MKRAAIANYTCPILSFCKIMDIMVNTTKINKFMPPQVKSKKTYGYTHEHDSKIIGYRGRENEVRDFARQFMRS